MTLVDKTTAVSRRPTYSWVILNALKEIAIWHAAWQEHQRVRQLDRDALRDMGITQAERESITVAQIAARMRG